MNQFLDCLRGDSRFSAANSGSRTNVEGGRIIGHRLSEVRIIE